VAEMIRERLATSPQQGMPTGERVTASFGVATVEAGQRPDAVFPGADMALYMAKNAGRDRVVRAGNTAPLSDRRRGRGRHAA
jgi:PleD family two-component response regulator